MELDDLQREVRDLMARFRFDVQGAVDIGHDISRATELFLLELFREVYELPDLRNLNEDRPNFPGLDLGDEQSGTAFQISASRDLGKILESLETVIREGLNETYPHVKIFVTTEKQRSYKQESIDNATDGKLAFDAKNDVLDARDLLKLFGTFQLDRLERVAVILRKHFPLPTAPTMVRAMGEALERDLVNRYRLAVQRSTFPENAGADVVAELAREVLGNGNAQLSEVMRRRILLRAARSAALTGHLESAEQFVSAAIVLNGSDTDLPARARIAEARGDVEGAIRILRDQRDSDSISTLLSVIARSKGDSAALAWFSDQHVSTSDLTSNGALTLVQIHLRDERLGEALRVLEDLGDAHLTESPYLLLLRGVVRLASVFSKADQRLISGMPLQVGIAAPVLPEAELATRLDVAIGDLRRLQEALRELNLPLTIRVSEAYARWCELLHPNRHANALRQLRRDMLEPARAIHCVQFAFAFDDSFDPKEIEEWLHRREAIGGLDDDELRAALVVRIHGDPAQVAQLMAKHRERIRELLGEDQALIIEVQALAAAKDATSARVLLDAGKGLLDAVAVLRLEVEIAKAEGADPVVEHLRAFEATRTTEALRLLVNALTQRTDHRALGHYAELLYADTGDPRDVELAAGAFANAGDYENFLRIMEAYSFLSDRDPRLKRRYGWQLFQTGRLQEARRIAEELRAGGSSLRDLNLEIAIAVETGQWEALAVPLAAYLDEPVAHDGLALIRAAHLAHEAGLGSSRQLMEAAVRKSPNDVQVLIGAYTLAMESGLEEVGSDAQRWFRRALDLSGPDGPVQQFELKDLLAQQAEWMAHSHTVDEAIISGEMPLVVGAPALRTTMVEAILGNFVRNCELADPRKRSLIPVFSGRRAPAGAGEVKRVALDISAVLVLGWLGLLPKVLASIDKVVLPAGLLQDLFEGRRRARASQKSQLQRARRLQDLIGHGLKVLPSSYGVSIGLTEEIGIELATLIEAAQTNNGVVVRPAPVHRLGLEAPRDVDMSPYASQLTDMHSLLDALKSLGAVDQYTEHAARRYFEIQDLRWAHPVQPERTQAIYIDSLAIAYLQATRLLDAVARSFETVYVHGSVEEQAVATLDAERRADELLRIVDAIREAIGNADAAGKVVFGPRSARAEKDEMRVSSTLHLLSDLLDVEAVIVDDRALNKNLIAIDGKNHQARILTSLDVIEELHARGEITGDERLMHRHRLRVAGAALMAVDADEIRFAAEQISLNESLEFRAIRESIALARMRKAPRFPSEVPWFVSVVLSTKGAIQEVWKRESDTERTALLADAILDIRPNIVEWISCWEGEPPFQWAEAVISSMTAIMMLPVGLIDAKVRRAYHAWLEQRILGPMSTLEPDRYQAAVEHVKSLILTIARDDDE